MADIYNNAASGRIFNNALPTDRIGPIQDGANIEDGVDKTYMTGIVLLELLRQVNRRLKNQNIEDKGAGLPPMYTIVDKAYLTNNLLVEAIKEAEEIARTIFR